LPPAPDVDDDRYRAATGWLRERSAAPGLIAPRLIDAHSLESVLPRMRALLDALDRPGAGIPIIHVAGSKGKGSTATFAANILIDSGLRTGLFTSPHLHSWRERIVVDRRLVDKDAFADVVANVRSAVERIEREDAGVGAFNVFQILTAMGLLHFHRESCQAAIVEVGLGGRYDPTNIVQPVVSVITTIEREHAEVLGPGLDRIAWNKAGIIEPGIPVVTPPQRPEVLSVIASVAAERGSPLVLGGRDWRWQDESAPQSLSYIDAQGSIAGIRVSIPGRHQRQNAATAVAAVRAMPRPQFDITDDAIRSALASTAIPGRFERVSWRDRACILDGAHSEDSLAALAAALQESGIDDIIAIVGMLRDKPLAVALGHLGPIAKSIILTPLEHPRSWTRAELESAARGFRVTGSLDDALRVATEGFQSRHPLVLTGSFALVAEARTALGLPIPD
jgi:dihydrofolate synthase / folylpolyglutamate synthase